MLVLFEMLMMLARQPVEDERLLDCFLDPSDEPRITRAPFGDPGGEVAAGASSTDRLS
jgi:hypothetical protein